MEPWRVKFVHMQFLWGAVEYCVWHLYPEVPLWRRLCGVRNNRSKREKMEVNWMKFVILYTSRSVGMSLGSAH